jgi:hypothetical protein
MAEPGEPRILNDFPHHKPSGAIRYRNLRANLRARTRSNTTIEED